MKSSIAASAFALALLAAGSASAQGYRIPIGDLALGSADGAAQFDRRVNRAARWACDAGSPIEKSRCVVEFRTEALRALPDARRDDYARARGGRDQVRVPVVAD